MPNGEQRTPAWLPAELWKNAKNAFSSCSTSSFTPDGVCGHFASPGRATILVTLSKMSSFVMEFGFSSSSPQFRSHESRLGP